MLKKADATDNNTGDYHTSRATLNTTGVPRKRSPRSFSRRRTGRRGVYRWHQTPEHHPRVVGGRPLPYSGSPNDHELSPRRSASSAAQRLAADRSWRTSTRPACAPDQTSVASAKGQAQPIYCTSDERQKRWTPRRYPRYAWVPAPPATSASANTAIRPHVGRHSPTRQRTSALLSSPSQGSRCLWRHIARPLSRPGRRSGRSPSPRRGLVCRWCLEIGR